LCFFAVSFNPSYFWSIYLIFCLGLLTIVLFSNVQCSARVFFTTQKRKMDWQYPAKPYDSTVTATVLPNYDSDAEMAVVNVKWTIPLEIEAIISRKQPEWTICDELGENLESIHCVNQTTNTLNIPKLKVRITVLRKYLQISAKSERQKQVRKGRKDFNLLCCFFFQILIALYSCNGYIRLAIHRKGRQIFRSNSFTGYHRFLITDVVSGYITIDIINDDEKSKYFRIWASTAPQKIPYPQLPEDTSIKIMKRTCSSVTLQWMKSHNTKVRYCLYKRREEAKYIDELISNNSDFSFVLKPMSSTAKIYDYEGDTYNPIFETTVTGLEAGATYNFDLLAQPLHRSHTQQLPYRTVWARTLNC
uniref:NDNF_C domain-containing protein n=1 Tax=Enterobius vermicularis TaxID=51028 RepID=A0A158QAF7_ENTVE